MGLKINGLTSLQKKLAQLGDKATEALKQGILAGCLLIEKDAKLNVKSDTGALRESINHEIIEDKKSITGVVGTNFKYAPFIELGTGPVGQANKPEIASKLNISYRQDSWVYYSEGKEQFFTTSGQPGIPYLYPALINNKDEIRKLIIEAVDRAFKKLEDK